MKKKSIYEKPSSVSDEVRGVDKVDTPKSKSGFRLAKTEEQTDEFRRQMP